MADTDKTPPPAPYTPPGQIDPAELMKAFVEDGVIEAPPAGKTGTSEVAKPAAEAAKPVDDTPQLLKIAREKDALRKEREAAGPHLDMLKEFSPQEAKRLAQARAKGSARDALAALGFTHQQYTAEMLGTKPATSETEVPEKTGDPEVLSVKQELAALKAERENERVQASRREALSKMEATLKDNPKFASVVALKEYEAVEAVLLNHWNEFKELPGATFEESVVLAAEVVEKNLRIQAERYRGLLTPAPTSGQVAAKAPESPRTAPESPRTLTNANTTAPAAARTTPKTRDEVIEALSKGEDLDDSYL